MLVNMKLIVLCALLLQASASVSRLAVDISHVPSSFIKDAFVNEVKQFKDGEIKIDQCKEQLFTIISNLKSPNPVDFYHSFEGECFV